MVSGELVAKRPRTGDAPSDQPEIFQLFGNITVGQVVGPGLGKCLHLKNTLRDGASALAQSGRGAVAVADASGALLGILTESDVVRCYFEGADQKRMLGDWFESGLARAPAKLFDRLTVTPDDRLSTVAEKMVQNALAGDCACHHVLVKEDILGSSGKHAVLCSLDIVGALWKAGKDIEYNPTLHHAATETQVYQIMKPREGVFTCLPNETMHDILRVFLTTHQNSLMVVDDEGVYGIVTPRDAVKAFVDGVSHETLASDWLRGTEVGIGPRVISSSATVEEAAAMMSARTLNHLVVTAPGERHAVGVLSSLDIACHASRRALPEIWKESLHQESGPRVGTVVEQNWHLQAVCQADSSIADAARFLEKLNRTSAAVAVGGDVALLTDTGLMRAFVDGWSGDAAVQKLLVREAARPGAMPPLVVPRDIKLTDAAQRMLAACDWRKEPCRHLIVKGEGAAWSGVFSALDVAKALCRMGSELDRATLGVGLLKVMMVMRPADTVPFCRPADTLKDAFKALLGSCQHALIVVDAAGDYLGLITPRCALKALSEGISPDVTVAKWCENQPREEETREVTSETPLMSAAAIMTETSRHHLVVKDPGASEATGVLSALDILRGVVSMRSWCPVTSLGWLSACQGPDVGALWAA